MGMTLRNQPSPPSPDHQTGWEEWPAAQQPQWRHHPDYYRTREALDAASALVTPSELNAVQQSLAAVASGSARLMQVGDCAESFYECTPEHTSAKAELLDRLSDHLENDTGQPVVRIGRLGGQFAKPRSESVERYGDIDLPVFRGHLVNSEFPAAGARAHDPRRMLWAYEASAKVQSWLRSHRERRDHNEKTALLRGPWSSHEALVMDYEASSIRTDSATGTSFLSSTHLPWVGNRTRQPDCAQVRLLSSVRNPVACKIGPKASLDEVLRVCELLDPSRVPGRLALIVRMGKNHIGTELPRLAAGVRQAGHPVVWLSDPMHGNTVRTSSGMKTRFVDDVTSEAIAFRDVLLQQGEHPGGLHLEAAASGVTECIGGAVPDEDWLRFQYTTLCDPRLNSEQALELLETWTSGLPENEATGGRLPSWSK